MEPYVEAGNNFFLLVPSFDIHSEPVDRYAREEYTTLSPRCDVLYTFHAIRNDRTESSISEKRGGP